MVFFVKKIHCHVPTFILRQVKYYRSKPIRGRYKHNQVGLKKISPQQKDYIKKKETLYLYPALRNTWNWQKGHFLYLVKSSSIPPVLLPKFQMIICEWPWLSRWNQILTHFSEETPIPPTFFFYKSPAMY